MNPPILSRNTYLFLFLLLSLVYVIGLFVPLMDNDSAHHANIALHMYLTGDYVNLIDAGKDYLDKPHLLFWLCAVSYKIFGVTTFAYKFPPFLFTLFGIYSTYRLGKTLYNNNEAGKLAALILASSFAFILANNDVRMEAILTASIAFATWQGVEFIHHKKISNAIGLATGLALGFCTKGHIAIIIPAVGLFFYILYKKEFLFFINWKWLVVLICFASFISPVIYCYYLQFNLHPEKIIRGHDHINGVKFILFNQSFERFSGGVEANTKKDYLFFFHSFLWAFTPWSIVCYWAIAEKFKNGFTKTEWLTVSTLLLMAIIIAFSKFKLPHYINVVFPAASVLTASWLIDNIKKEKSLYKIQMSVSIIILILSAILNFWFFLVKSYFVIAGLIISLAIFFHYTRSKQFTAFQKALVLPVCSILVFLFLYNSNYSPQLLTYQCGNQLAKKIKGKIDPDSIFFYKTDFSSSFNFYTSGLRKEFSDSFLKENRSIWLLYDRINEPALIRSGFVIQNEIEVADYEVSKAEINFLNPASRQKVLKRVAIARISRKQ